MTATLPPSIPPFRYQPFVQHLDLGQKPAIDIVGDVHGCWEELRSLLQSAGYELTGENASSAGGISLSHPEGRQLVLLGDLTDRGPGSDKVLRLAMDGRTKGNVHIVMGNHDWKLYRYLESRPVVVQHGLGETLVQISRHGKGFALEVRDFYRSVPHQIGIPMTWKHAYRGGRTLWLVHAAAKTHRQGMTDKDSFERSIYGYSDGAVDAAGGLDRFDWAAAYCGDDPVIHGHVVHAQPTMKNRVLCLDTGCVFGGQLTMLRLDSGSYLQTPALANHAGKEKVFL